jgi:uncharacterized membrane protein
MGSCLACLFLQHLLPHVEQEREEIDFERRNHLFREVTLHRLLLITLQGCYAVVTNFLQAKLGIMAASAMGLAFFQLFGFFLTVCLANLLQKTKYEQMT